MSSSPNRSLNYYRHLSPTQTAQLDDQRRAEITAQLERFGHAEVARERIGKLQQEVARINQRWTQLSFWLLLGLLGALLYSGTAQIVTLPLPNWIRTPAAFPIGAGFALIGEDRAKRFFTSIRLWCRCHGAVQQLRQHKSTARNPLDAIFYHSKLALLCKVEAKSPTFLDGLLALFMILIESAAVYYLMLPLQGMTLALLAALIPLAVILMIASAVSDHFDLPAETVKIVHEYQTYIAQADDDAAPEQPPSPAAQGRYRAQAELTPPSQSYLHSPEDN